MAKKKKGLKGKKRMQAAAAAQKRRQPMSPGSSSNRTCIGIELYMAEKKCMDLITASVENGTFNEEVHCLHTDPERPT